MNERRLTEEEEFPQRLDQYKLPYLKLKYQFHDEVLRQLDYQVYIASSTPGFLRIVFPAILAQIFYSWKQKLKNNKLSITIYKSEVISSGTAFERYLKGLILILNKVGTNSQL